MIEISGKISQVDIVSQSHIAKSNGSTEPEEISKSEVSKIEIILSRPPVLSGKTYRIQSPLSAHSFYITINDIEIDGKIRPFEIFINTRDTQHIQWTTLVTKLTSAIFRKGGDIRFVTREFLSVIDPTGGYHSQGKYIPSLAAEIGLTIEEHFKSLGLSMNEGVDQTILTFMTEKIVNETGKSLEEIPKERCAKCYNYAVIRSSGCYMCQSCGDSKCE